MYTEQDIHHLIIRLFAGEANQSEQEIVETWLEQDDNNRKLFDDLKEIWQGTWIDQDTEQYDLESAIQKFRQKTSFINAKAKRRNQLLQIGRYAAILLLGILIPVSYYFLQELAVDSVSYTTITCPEGDKSTIVLPDSSTVILNSGSKLTFNTDFRNGTRQLFLDGEAYFSVRKDPRNPFRVKTETIEVEVLGTEFNLMAYANEAISSTTLVSGSLRVSSENNSYKIEPNQKLVFDKVDKQTNLFNLSDLSPETAWTEGRLVFRNQSLEELELKLERWFDVEIEFADEQVKSRRFTGTLTRESILEVIAYLGNSKYVAYEIENNVITFYTEQKN
ncbi:FecR family protein [Gaoshiqia sediminis]|uniref:DUF4974 domain-containing protein n=1 Tax=Gaoshiqia sediminis TaxID=2986998 RepID=A0AA41YB81_9BACT|nr:FecR domain-containing protein [Gaoshiqia sediminis]MCW0484498.1 DUF4974 domain-containing protein [Gaoshiqia sediminis]